MKFRTLPLSRIKRGQRLLVRVDANVPLKKNRIVPGGTWRLEAVVSYLRELSKRGAIVIVCSHIGRPHGKPDKMLSMKPVARWLARVGQLNVKLAPGIVGNDVARVVNAAKPGEIIVLENVRFDAREKNNSKAFANALGALADVYINNAFGTSHRKHASVHAITQVLPSYAGPILVEETNALLKKRTSPFVLVMGGVKLDTKLPVIEALAPSADTILLGGGVSLTLQAARDKRVLRLNRNAIDKKELALARRALNRFGEKIVLPIDYVVEGEGRSKVLWEDEVSTKDHMIDIGPKTREQFAQHLKEAETIIWNGTMGIVEQRGAQGGTVAVAKSIAANTSARSVLGGGDTISFLRHMKLDKGFDHLSTGGGAMLVFLAGEAMPGLEVLKK